MKNYELKIENWGDDVLMLASRGHHDISDFKNKCRCEYVDISLSLTNCDCPCEHLYYKAVPRYGYNSWYAPVSKHTRGSFPVTVWWGA